MTRSHVIDTYFIETRHKLLDVAAFLDRVERAQAPEAPADAPACSCGAGNDDVRIVAMRDAIQLLLDGQGDRARRILDLFSDMTTEPIAKAPGKGAIGAPPDYRG